MGDRYGFRPIQTEIKVKEFEGLLKEAESLKLANVALLEEWYKKDENAVPPHYVLQVELFVHLYALVNKTQRLL